MTQLDTEYSVSHFELDAPQFIPVPKTWRLLEYAWIDIRIENRPNTVGVIDLEKLTPRQWSGYWWLYHQNKVVKNGAIEFENQRIFYDQMFWLAELPANDYSMQFSTIDPPTDWDTTVDDETDELAVYDMLTNTADLKNYYAPIERPYDFLGVWFPAGVLVTVNFSGLKFSPISVAGSNNDFDIYQDEDEDGIFDYFVDPPPPVFPMPGLGTNTQKNFDELARERGYILPIECGLPPIQGNKITFFSFTYEACNGGSCTTYDYPQNEVFIEDVRSVTARVWATPGDVPVDALRQDNGSPFSPISGGSNHRGFEVLYGLDERKYYVSVYDGGSFETRTPLSSPSYLIENV